MSMATKQQSLTELDKAVALFEISDYAAAHDAAKTAVRLNPDCIQARILFARINLKRQNPKLANRALDVISQIAPDYSTRPDLAMLRAQTLIQLERFEQARMVVDALITRFPDDDRAYRLAVELNLKQDQPQSAAKHLEQVIRICPNDITAIRQLARLIAPDAPLDAATLLQSTLAKTDISNPNFDTTYTSHIAATRFQLAMYLKRAGRAADAETELLTLVTDAPEDGDVWLELGKLADERGAIDLAITRFTQSALCKGNHQFAAAAGLATTAMHAGRFGQAAMWWHRIAHATVGDISDHASDAWAAMVVTAICAQRPRLAQLAHNRLTAIVENPATRQHKLARAWVHASAGEVIHSTTEFDPARQLERNPSPDHLVDRLLTQAVITFDESGDAQYRWADTYYHTAVCERHLGNDEQAAQAVQSALDINPNYRAAARLAATLKVGPDTTLRHAA